MALIQPMIYYVGSHVLGGRVLLRKAGCSGLLHRPWGVLKGAHGWSLAQPWILLRERLPLTEDLAYVHSVLEAY